MKMTLLLLVIILCSCGKEKYNGNSADQGTQQFFGQFVSMMNGQSTGRRLKASNVSLQQNGILQNSLGQSIFLELDSNGIFYLYLAQAKTASYMPTSAPLGLNDLDTLNGQWQIDNNSLVLEGVANSPDYRSTNINTTGIVPTNVFSTCSFPITFIAQVNLAPNQQSYGAGYGQVGILPGSSQNTALTINAGQTIQFVLERSQCDVF